MRRPSKFKKTDVTRLTEAVLAAGLEVTRVEFSKDGSIIVVPARAPQAIKDDEPPEDLRKLL